MQPDRHLLVERIEQTAKANFEGSKLTNLLHGSFGSVTKRVKEILGKLGKELGYKVAAAGFPAADEGEWLYDMVWYLVDDKGLFLEQIMVLESELNRRGGLSRSADVDGDFQKLVQARAGVRVWFVDCPNENLAQQHIDNCKRQARLFGQALPGDAYLFIAYN